MSYFYSLSFFLLFCFAAKGQNNSLPSAESCNIECTYKLTYQPDSTSNISRSEVMYLLLGKGLSKFESRGLRILDSISANPGNNLTSQNDVQELVNKMKALPRGRFHYTIYKSLTKEKIYYFDRIGKIEYNYEEPLNLFNWTLTPTTATIAGYSCQRAITSFGGRTWEAWFTREIPLGEGPYKFRGLPGLIVKIGDSRHHYIFELIKLSKETNKKLITLPSGKFIATSKSSFQQATINFNQDPVSHLASPGSGEAGEIFQNPEEARARARERAKKQNNPLELK